MTRHRPPFLFVPLHITRTYGVTLGPFGVMRSGDRPVITIVTAARPRSILAAEFELGYGEEYGARDSRTSRSRSRRKGSSKLFLAYSPGALAVRHTVSAGRRPACRHTSWLLVLTRSAGLIRVVLEIL